MSVRKSPCQIRKNDVRRALEAAAAAGKKVTEFKIDQTGTVTIIFDNNGAADTAPANNEWDTVAE